MSIDSPSALRWARLAAQEVADVQGAVAGRRPFRGSEADDLVSALLGLPSPRPEATVHDAYLVCLEDHGRYPCLARHVEACHGISFAEYLARWRLPPSYPRVCAAVSRRRSEAARAAPSVDPLPA